MLTPDAAVGLALDLAREALRAKEMPIGAVIISGDDVLGLAVNLEPCLMCMGAAMALGVQKVSVADHCSLIGRADGVSARACYAG